MLKSYCDPPFDMVLSGVAIFVVLVGLDVQTGMHRGCIQGQCELGFE